MDGREVLAPLLGIGYVRHGGGQYRLSDPVFGVFSAAEHPFSLGRGSLRWRTSLMGCPREFRFAAGGDILAAHRRMLEYAVRILQKSLYVSFMDAALLRATGFRVAGRDLWRKYSHSVTFTDSFSRKTYYHGTTQDGKKLPPAVCAYATVQDMLAVDGSIL